MTMLHEAFTRRPGSRTNAEAGQGLAEYALILAFVALAVIAAMTLLGTAVTGSISNVAGKF